MYLISDQSYDCSNLKRQLVNSMPSVALPTRADVVALCEKVGPKQNGFAYNEFIWIKYGECVTEAEAMTQQLVYQYADPSIVRTPAVYDYFSKARMTYIIMERVQGQTYGDHVKQHREKAPKLLEAVAEAVRHVWTIKVPPGASPGPLGRQIPEDRFFTDRGAGQTFDTTADLEQWVNAKLINTRKSERVDFALEKLHLCHCDLASHNILIPVLGAIYLIDWGMSGFYPLVFEEYALLHQFNLPGGHFAKQLKPILFGDKASPNLRPLCLVGRINAQGG
jgi:tRNA A-37 threonylcarbamoyl transferase component Bud32